MTQYLLSQPSLLLPIHCMAPYRTFSCHYLQVASSGPSVLGAGLFACLPPVKLTGSLPVPPGLRASGAVQPSYSLPAMPADNFHLTSCVDDSLHRVLASILPPETCFHTLVPLTSHSLFAAAARTCQLAYWKWIHSSHGPAP
jgi:hypothetical protein